MAQQTQIRQDVASDLTSATPVEGEPGYDRTNKRLLVGDGARSEGIPHPNFWDLQNQTFVFCAAPGSSNSPADGDDMTFDITDGTLDYNPTTYTAGLRVAWKQAIANTGAVTIDIDGLGPKTVKKNAGADDLVAGDLQAGGIYEATYDGTNLQLGGTAGASGLPAPDFTSSEQTVSFETQLDVAHGLAAIPTLYTVSLRCKTTQNDYAVGDEILISTKNDTTQDEQIVALSASSTNVTISTGTAVGFLRKAAAAGGQITAGNWRWVVRAWA